MKYRPMLFSGPMVRGLLDGSKTQTRRIANKPVKHPDFGYMCTPNVFVHEKEPQHVIDRACPHGQPGGRLWVRESFYEEFSRAPIDEEERKEWVESGYLAYRASDEQPYGSGGSLPWRPSIHMPRWASRITLEIVSVRVERLQDISEADAIAEGIEREAGWWKNYDPSAGWRYWESPIQSCRTLWESINGPGSWDANPWVWVVQFSRVEGGA